MNMVLLLLCNLPHYINFYQFSDHEFTYTNNVTFKCFRGHSYLLVPGGQVKNIEIQKWNCGSESKSRISLSSA